MDAIREAGLGVPDDISVAGFDNRDVSEFVYPKLTTVEIDLKAIGFAAAKVATQRLDAAAQKNNAIPQKPDGEGASTAPHSEENVNGFSDNGNVIIPCKIILRDTVKQIKLNQ